MLDLAAYYHDIAYFNAKVGGLSGALWTIEALQADIELFDAAKKVTFMHFMRQMDIQTKRPVSFKTYLAAQAVMAFFGNAIMEKETRILISHLLKL